MAGMAPSAGLESPPGRGLWQNRNWRLFWLSQSASLAGDIVFDTSVLLWVVQIIALHQPWAPAAGSGVLIAAVAPALLLGPFAGVFVDRWDRRRTMLVADAVRALLVAALVPLAFPSVAGHVPRVGQLAVIFVLVATAACFSQFARPAWRPPGPVGPSGAEGARGFGREFAAGLRFFVASPVLVALGVGLFATVLGASALNALNVFFIQADLHSSASLYGTMGMAEGIGGLVGILAAGRVIARAGAGRVFCAGLVLSGVAIVCYSLMSSLIIALAVIAVIGVVLGCVNTAIAPLMLAATPQQMIGRVTSVITPAASAAAIASLAAAGALPSTALRGLHARLAGVTFGPYNTIIGVGGLLFIAAGLAAIGALSGRRRGSPGEPP